MIVDLDTPERRYGPLSQMLSGIRLIPRHSDAKKDDVFFSAVKRGAFCDRWSAAEILDTLNETGCLGHWRQQGFSQVWASLDDSDCADRFSMTVWTSVGNAAEILMQIVVWLDYIRIERLNLTLPSFGVEHLRLQNPGKPAQHAMPGQDYASSGLLRRIFGIVKAWADCVGAQIITEIPEFFHTAFIFGQVFRFIDEEMASIFASMQRDLLCDQPVTHELVSEVSRAFENGRILYHNRPYAWPTEVQGYGLSHEMADLLGTVPACANGGVFRMMP